MAVVRSFKTFCVWILQRVPVLGRHVLPSAGYRCLSRAQAEVFNDSASSWHSRHSADWQANAYLKLLEKLRAGAPRLDFTLAARAVEKTGLPHPVLLEAGCGNGYYSEVLSRLVPGGVDYTGLDYSREMVESARSLYPAARFIQGDSTRLEFADSSFDIVMDGVSLMHILNYRQAIAEYARVARSHVIFNCIPVTDGPQTHYLRKFAYGAPTIEICFGRGELVNLLTAAGLEIVDDAQALAYDLYSVIGYPSTMRTILCRKRLKA
jgi:SAM-dependent methyltransferase